MHSKSFTADNRAAIIGGRNVGDEYFGAADLHAKTFSVDRSRIFIGSFNFDPRSTRLNAELGFVIESPVLAGHIEAAFNGRIRPS